MILYDKLVRDKVPSVIKASGRNCIYREASGPETVHYLIKKLHEEADELERALSHEDQEDELVDLITVIVELCRRYGTTANDLLPKGVEKFRRLGDFKGGIILITADPRPESKSETESMEDYSI